MRLHLIAFFALILHDFAYGEIKGAASEVPKSLTTVNSHVVIVDRQEKVVCAGALVAARWVVCPAHCFEKEAAKNLSVQWTTSGDLKVKAPVLEVIYYDKELTSREQPNFDVAMVKIGGKVDTGWQPVAVTANDEKLSVDSLRAVVPADTKKDRDIKVDLVATIDSSRLFNLIQIAALDPVDRPRERSLLKHGVLYSVKEGARSLVGMSAWAPATLLDGQRGLFYTDLRRYREFIADVSSGKPHKVSELPGRGVFSSFADWCRYDNYSDEAWSTVQQLLWSLSAKVGTYPLKLFTDCQYAADMAYHQAQKEIRFTGHPDSSGYRPLRSLEPLVGLGEINTLSIYFSDMTKLQIPAGLKIGLLEIVATSIDEASLCDLMEKAEIRDIGLWKVQAIPVDISCLLKSASIKAVDLAYSKVKHPDLLETLKKKVELSYTPL